MNFSVIIPVRNRPELIARCVAGVLACERIGELEVIVVDNGSTDDTGQRAAQAWREAPEAARAGTRFELAHEPRVNRCHARNTGAAAARGEWLAFLDSDCVPEAQWLVELARAIEGEDATLGAVGGWVVGQPSNAVEQFFETQRWFDQGKYLEPRAEDPWRPFAIGANLCVRRELFHAIGGFDPALHQAVEDADLCWRVTARGARLIGAPRARVRHYHRATAGGLFRQAYGWGRGQPRLEAKWPEEFPVARRRARTARHVVWALKSWVKAPFGWISGRNNDERRHALLDALANTGLALGRVAGRWLK